MTGNVISTALRILMGAGLAGDELVHAIAEIEDSLRPQRSSGAARQAAYRERLKAEKVKPDVTGDVTDITDVTLRNAAEVSPKKEKSIPPSHTPPISPLSLQDALKIWNEMAGRTGLPNALNATGKRQAAMKARIAEYGEEGFRKAVAAVERSKFCRGDNDRGWRADLGFLLRPDNFLKLLEGGYDPKGSKGYQPPKLQSDEEAASLKALNAARDSLPFGEWDKLRNEHFRRFSTPAGSESRATGPPGRPIGEIIKRATA